MWAGFFCRQDVSITIFGHTKEFSEVRGTSLMCNFGVRSRFLDVIYGVRPPSGSPGPDKMSSLICIQTVWHTDGPGLPERIIKKKELIFLRRFFCAAKTYAKNYGLENIYNFTLKIFVHLNCEKSMKNYPVGKELHVKSGNRNQAKVFT